MVRPPTHLITSVAYIHTQLACGGQVRSGRTHQEIAKVLAFTDPQATAFRVCRTIWGVRSKSIPPGPLPLLCSFAHIRVACSLQCTVEQWSNSAIQLQNRCTSSGPGRCIYPSRVHSLSTTIRRRRRLDSGNRFRGQNDVMAITLTNRLVGYDRGVDPSVVFRDCWIIHWKHSSERTKQRPIGKCNILAGSLSFSERTDRPISCVPQRSSGPGEFPWTPFVIFSKVPLKELQRRGLAPRRFVCTAVAVSARCAAPHSRRKQKPDTSARKSCSCCSQPRPRHSTSCRIVRARLSCTERSAAPRPPMLRLDREE